MQPTSHAHIDCIIEGFRVDGWAAEDPPYEFPDNDDLFEIIRGAAGDENPDARPMYGGGLILKVLPTSPAAQWGIQQRNYFDDANRNGFPHRVYGRDGSPAMFADPTRSIALAMIGGVFNGCPKFPTGGQTFEIKFHFEQMIPDVDGGIFTPSLATPVYT